MKAEKESQPTCYCFLSFLVARFHQQILRGSEKCKLQYQISIPTGTANLECIQNMSENRGEGGNVTTTNGIDFCSELGYGEKARKKKQDNQ